MSDAHLEAVPRAVIQAWKMPRKKVKGFFLTITKYMLGRKMAPWMMSPTITVTMYMPSCLPTTSRSLMEMILPQMRQAIPKGEYLFRGKRCLYVLQSQLFTATTEDLAIQLA